MSRKFWATGIALTTIALISIILINQVQGGANPPLVENCFEARVEITFTDGDPALVRSECNPPSILGGVFLSGTFTCKATEFTFSASTEPGKDPSVVKGVFLTAEARCGDRATILFTSSCSGITFQINLPPGSTPHCYEPVG